MRDQGLQKTEKTLSASNQSYSHYQRFYPHALSFVQTEPPHLCFHRLRRSQGLAHAIFTRHGGLSDPPYSSLNMAYSVGDNPGNVTGNLYKIKQSIGAARLIFLNQVHGNHIFVFKHGDHSLPDDVPTGDAMITDIPGIALMVQQADCQGILIFDPNRRVIANVHCGWRGNVNNILGMVVTRMKEVFDCRAPELLAAIGPSLGPCCAEFISYNEIFPKEFKDVMARENYFDLWSLSRRQLIEAGLLKQNIELSRVCTRCHTDLFYSYRAEKETGRFGTVAMIR